MRFLLDTDIVIDYLTEQPIALTSVPIFLSQGAALSILTVSEIYEGIYGSRDPAAAEAGFLTFLKGARVLGISRTVARRTALIRNELRRANRPVTKRAIDLLIGATAIEHELILITRNRQDYGDITGLNLAGYP